MWGLGLSELEPRHDGRRSCPPDFISVSTRRNFDRRHGYQLDRLEVEVAVAPLYVGLELLVPRIKKIHVINGSLLLFTVLLLVAFGHLILHRRRD